MARTPTKVLYPLNGTQTEFQVPFEYLKRSFVEVTLVNLIGSIRQPLVLNVDYRFVADRVIQTTRPWGVSAGFAYIELNRHTDAVTRIVDFNDGSVLRARELNVSQVQAIHIAEEGRNIAEIAMQLQGLNWDAQNRRIVRLADPVDLTDAANKQFVQSELARVIGSISGSANIAGNVVMLGFDGVTRTVQDLGNAVGSQMIGHEDGRPGTIPRSVQDALNDVRSVTSFGADPTGVNDSTSAFIAAGPGAFVPDGRFKVDPEVITPSRYWGNGTIVVAGNDVTLDHPFLDGPCGLYLGGSPLMGWEASGPNAQIYSGAGNATQGLTCIRRNGMNLLIISQRVAGASWSPEEAVRFSSWGWTGDGSDMHLIEFTQPLLCGHGSDITAFEENGELYIITTAGNDGTAFGGPSNGGKGYSKIHWRGAQTTQADVQMFEVFGDPDNRYGLYWPQRASICATHDGRNIIAIATSYDGTGRFFFVYDRTEVEAAGKDARNVRPVTGPVPFERANGEMGSTMQGMTSDGVHLYTVWGGGSVRSAKSILVYDMNGRLRRHLPYGAAGALYSESELRGNSGLGIPVSFEPEGICLFNGELLTLSIDAWKEPNVVVTDEGRNWANINTTATAGRDPWNRASWVVTDLPANTVFNISTPYAAGPYKARKKRIMVLTRNMEHPRLLRGNGGTDATSGTMKEYYPGTDIAWNAENGSFTFAKFYEALGSYKKFMEFNYDNTLNLFSTKRGEPNDQWVSIKSWWEQGGMNGMQLRSRGGQAGLGASIDLHADTSSTPGEAVVSSMSINDAVRIRNGSSTAATLTRDSLRLFVSDLVRATSDGAVSLGDLLRNWKSVHSLKYAVGVSTCTIESGIGSPEGVVDISAGSLYLRRDPNPEGNLYVKTTGNGSNGWTVLKKGGV